MFLALPLLAIKLSLQNWYNFIVNNLLKSLKVVYWHHFYQFRRHFFSLLMFFLLLLTAQFRTAVKGLIAVIKKGK